MRLGFILTPGFVNSLYRVVYPMQALERRGHEVVWPTSLEDDVPMRELFSCDLVHCFRREDRTPDLESLSRRGVAISVDNDDDTGELDLSEGVASVASRRKYAKQAALLAAQARQADLVTTPSRVIAAKYEAAGARNVAVIENYLDPNVDCFGSTSKHDGVVIGWVAGREHMADVGPLGITRTLMRLLDVHNDLKVVTVGVKLYLPKERYEHVLPVPPKELLRVLSQWDVGIAPLTDKPFNRARSNVKLKEYGAGKVAWLAASAPPYERLGPEQGGMLVRDGEWFDAINHLVRNPRLRRRLAHRALKWAKRQTTDRHVALWEAEFKRAIEIAAVGQPRTAGETATR